jgi:hypothetical protein
MVAKTNYQENAKTWMTRSDLSLNRYLGVVLEIIYCKFETYIAWASAITRLPRTPTCDYHCFEPVTRSSVIRELL